MIDPFIGDNFLLMHENARPQADRIVTEYCRHLSNGMASPQSRLKSHPACLGHAW